MGGVVSWATPEQAPGRPAPAVDPDERSLREALTQIVSPAPAVTSRAQSAAAEAAPPFPPEVTADPSPPTFTPQTTEAGADALLAAFARGIGLPTLKPAAGMTPEFMEHIGRMLRESVQGTVELLIARAATKREVRADVTMIVSKHNNPLKFSPDVNFALMQLLTPQGSGFMGPEEAMRDAYDDLRAHQIGFIAGMRAALSSVLTRFTPAELENRLSTKSLLDSVLPANRKAKLWDLYEQRYSEISREAEDDFHSLFGREFLKAYEAQIDQLQRDRG
ncbi:MAG: type VI secretion system-associated FHA domain protein TagH [Betaproteobacteria bacterium HGW-Betaproteobacteria-19]|nr:MAG: type VI secretion system-associated FHA domain protein TagH [Betaproteobacteria bacterium HGW-Betaproteobacteria-19]